MSVRSDRKCIICGNNMSKMHDGETQTWLDYYTECEEETCKYSVYYNFGEWKSDYYEEEFARLLKLKAFL